MDRSWKSQLIERRRRQQRLVDRRRRNFGIAESAAVDCDNVELRDLRGDDVGRPTLRL